LCLGFFSLSNYWGGLHPGLDLLGQFKWQFSLSLLLPLFLMGLMRRWKWVVMLLLLLGLHAIELLPWYLPVAHEKALASPLHSEIKVLLANVLNTNPEVTSLASLIKQEQPDIVALMEFHPKHLELMNGLGRAYPFRFQPRDKNYFGLGLWSKFPLHRAELKFLGQAELPTLGTWVDLGERQFYLISTHLDSPVRVPALRRNRQLDALGKFALSKEPPVLVMGDFNVSMYSPYYKQFERNSDLHNCRRGFGVLPSWPAYLPEVARIPIDQCLVSKQLEVVDLHLGTPVGSDHLPMVISLRFPVNTEIQR